MLYDYIIIGGGISGNISNYTFVNNLCSAGQVNKAGGSFVINHPDPLKTKTTQLIHSFVESPTAGDNIYRFKVIIIDGIGEIILPDYYKFLNVISIKKNSKSILFKLGIN